MDTDFQAQRAPQADQQAAACSVPGYQPGLSPGTREPFQTSLCYKSLIGNFSVIHKTSLEVLQCSPDLFCILLLQMMM